MSSILKKFVKDIIEEAFTFKWLILGIILYTFGSKSKEQLFYFAAQAELLVNKWDLLHSILGNIYLIVYVILPILLYRSVTIIISDFEYPILIRLRSYRNWVYQTLKEFSQTFSIIAIVWISVILLLLIGTPSFSGWSPFSELNTSFSESQILAKFISTPILALSLHLLLFTLSTFCIHLFLAIIYIQTKGKGIVIFTAIFIWVYSGVSFKLLPDSAFLFSLPNYLILHSGVGSFGNIWAPIIIVIGVFFLIIGILERIDINQSILKKLGHNWVYIVFTILTVISLWSGTQVRLGGTIWDQFIIIFFGSSQEGVNLKAFLSYFIINIGFVYLVSLFLQRELREIGYYELLRYQSVNKWFWSWFRKIIIYIGLYLISLASFSFLLSYLTGSSLSFNISIEDTFTVCEMLYHFFINGYLQLLFYTLFVFIIAWLWKETFYSLVGISIFSIFMFPGMNSKLIMPYGLNSIGYILNDQSTFYISFVLSLWIIAEIIAILYIFNKKDIDL